MLIGFVGRHRLFSRAGPHRLHKLNYLMPGTLTKRRPSSDVIIGLLLLLLAHGLRRRKRRAWQAVTALLAFDVGIHLFHYSQRIPTTVVALLEIVALLYFRNEFYAEGTTATAGGRCEPSSAWSGGRPSSG